MMPSLLLLLLFCARTMSAPWNCTLICQSVSLVPLSVNISTFPKHPLIKSSNVNNLRGLILLNIALYKRYIYLLMFCTSTFYSQVLSTFQVGNRFLNFKSKQLWETDSLPVRPLSHSLKLEHSVIGWIQISIVIWNLVVLLYFVQLSWALSPQSEASCCGLHQWLGSLTPCWQK